jgi:hypothetical protein
MRPKREVSSSISSAHQTAATASASTSHDNSDAAAAIARAMKVLGTRNKQRMEHVQYNKYEFATPEKAPSADRVAPLDYSQGAVDQADITELLLTRRNTNLTIGYGYSVPLELKEAARLVAESDLPSPSTRNHSSVAA